MKTIDVLIQNVSSQCIPNVAAVYTFKPKRVIWVYSDQSKPDMERLKEAVKGVVHKQDVWHVNVRDSVQLQRSFKQYFDALDVQGNIVFHLTCGTKSMALQGLMQLAFFHQKSPYSVRGVVMDPHTQQFDVIFPTPENDAYACAALDFAAILAAHGSWRQKGTGRDMKQLKEAYAPLQALRYLHAPLMHALKGRTLCSKEEAATQGYYLRGGEDLPVVVQQALALAQDAGVIKALHMHQAHFTFQAVSCDNPYAYIRNMWMEDWVGSVLAHHDMDAWCGGFSSVKVSIKSPEDYQEFDFLGVRNNHLVYWSCKNTAEVKVSQLFEIDALRDEVAGRDFHVAGLLHTADVAYGLRKKAQRLGLHLVQVTAQDADEQLIRASLR